MLDFESYIFNKISALNNYGFDIKLSSEKLFNKDKKKFMS